MPWKLLHCFERSLTVSKISNQVTIDRNVDASQLIAPRLPKDIPTCPLVHRAPHSFDHRQCPDALPGGLGLRAVQKEGGLGLYKTSAVGELQRKSAGNQSGFDSAPRENKNSWKKPQTLIRTPNTSCQLYSIVRPRVHYHARSLICKDGFGANYRKHLGRDLDLDRQFLHSSSTLSSRSRKLEFEDEFSRVPTGDRKALWANWSMERPMTLNLQRFHWDSFAALTPPELYPLCHLERLKTSPESNMDGSGTCASVHSSNGMFELLSCNPCSFHLFRNRSHGQLEAIAVRRGNPALKRRILSIIAPQNF